MRQSRETKMNRYWISWRESADDYRPLTDPPNEAICGWWCTGGGEIGWTIAAVVDAHDSEQAKLAVLKDWPEAQDEIKDWRFLEIENPNFRPSPGRYPIHSWMKERFQKLN